jgi:hypothetical protein
MAKVCHNPHNLIKCLSIGGKDLKAVGTLSPPFPDEQPVLPPVRLEVNDLARLEDPGEVVDLEGDVVCIDVGNAVADARIVARVAVPCVYPAAQAQRGPRLEIQHRKKNSHSDQLGFEVAFIELFCHLHICYIIYDIWRKIKID